MRASDRRSEDDSSGWFLRSNGDREVWKKVWDDVEKINFASDPAFYAPRGKVEE